jgi:pimeloyl-ACP methyl ester carboxylesterase
MFRIYREERTALPFSGLAVSVMAMEKPFGRVGQRRPWYSPARLLQRALIYCLVAYGTLCVFLYFHQDCQIYPGAFSGDPIDASHALQEASELGLMPWDHAAAGTAPPEGYVPRDFAAAAPRGTVVVFHGNGGWAAERMQYPAAFARRGFRTFLYEYPGYGGRPGRPREKTIVADARSLIWSLDRQGDGPIYVWGESLGSGVAASVVADPTLPVHGLVLMMPFDSLTSEALSIFPIVPVGLLLHDRYDSVANLTHFHHPICVIRGDKDTVIPPKLTLNLFAHLPDPKLMILQPGYGHGDWPSEPELSWWDDALNFIAPKK